MNEDEWQEYQRARAEAEAAWDLLREEEKAAAEEILRKLWEMLEAEFQVFEEDDDDLLFDAAALVAEAEQLLEELDN